MMIVSLSEEGISRRAIRYALGLTPSVMLAANQHYWLAAASVVSIFLYGSLEYWLGHLAERKTARLIVIEAMLKDGFTKEQIVEMVKHGRVGVFEAPNKD